MDRRIPTTLAGLQEELPVHAQAGRSDPGFRLNIVLSQIGSLAKHFTHDPVENPTARPYGSRDSEISEFGHALLQLMTYGTLRGIDLQESVNATLPHLREADFKKCEAKNTRDDMIIGRTAFPGKVRGKAFVDPDMSDIQIALDVIALSRIHCPGFKTILVTRHPDADARLAKFDAIITDDGGQYCHAATIAREKGIPCIVSTGDATIRIKHGDIVEVDAMFEEGQVWKV
jgi:phosphohistidine swiveling domain-containing protein